MAVLQSVTHSAKRHHISGSGLFSNQVPGSREQTVETSFCLYYKHWTHCLSLLSLPKFNTLQKSWGPNNSNSN